MTSYQDTVINLLATSQSFFGLTLPPLAANFDASMSSHLYDTLGHGFTEVYMSQNLPSGTSAANSIAAAIVKKVDTALYRTSTFFEAASYILVNGVKVAKPAGFPADSSSVMVCFPEPVGGF